MVFVMPCHGILNKHKDYRPTSASNTPRSGSVARRRVNQRTDRIGGAQGRNGRDLVVMDDVWGIGRWGTYPGLALVS